MGHLPIEIPCEFGADISMVETMLDGCGSSSLPKANDSGLAWMSGPGIEFSTLCYSVKDYYFTEG